MSETTSPLGLEIVRRGYDVAQTNDRVTKLGLHGLVLQVELLDPLLQRRDPGLGAGEADRGAPPGEPVRAGPASSRGRSSGRRHSPCERFRGRGERWSRSSTFRL